MPEFSVSPNPHVPIDIRYQDEELLIVEKPAGVVTQPGKGHMRDSLMNGLFARFGNWLQNMGADRDWGLLHRLDRETSGLVLVALRPRAYESLRQAFAERRVRKRYYAIVLGAPRPSQGTIQQPILEVIGQRKTAVVSRKGQPATTAYRVCGSSSGGEPPITLLEARPATGRLHQIRVHCAAIGCPVLGDDLYGSKAMPRVPRLCLHAAELRFTHPTARQPILATSPLPSDLRAVLRRFGLPEPADANSVGPAV